MFTHSVAGMKLGLEGMMNNDNTCSEICYGKCDLCGAQGLIVVFYLRGTPVLGECVGCNPHHFLGQVRKGLKAGAGTFTHSGA